MTNDLATRIRQYYETAAPPVDAEEVVERHAVRVGEGSRRPGRLGWFGKHPAAAVGATAVVTLLLVGGALWAVSSDPTPSTPVTPITEVTGDSSCAILKWGTWAGDSLPGRFTTQQRGQRNLCRTETSDPRVSGSWDVALNCDYSLEGDIIAGQCWGTLEMEGDSGRWVGTFLATTESSVETPDDIFHIIDSDVVGSGDYAGLRYIHRIEGIDSMTVTGQIGPVDSLGPPTTASP
ncbi:MAG: hypothetical protein QNJ77_12755 [Acidimicrobiia bacterium]|nr:hypothetical protein [Acidimicrobiia bacterium]